MKLHKKTVAICQKGPTLKSLLALTYKFQVPFISDHWMISNKRDNQQITS